MNRESDGFLAGKFCGSQVRLQSQIVANWDDMSRKPIGIEWCREKSPGSYPHLSVVWWSLCAKGLLRHELRDEASGMAKRKSGMR